MMESVKNYLKKPYARILIPAEEGRFSAEILEFPGCFAEGNTPNETFEALEKAAQSWIEAALEQKQEIPEPFDNRGYGGKVALRLPRSIHRQAVRMAERDQTSLNQFLVSSIAERIGAEDLYNRLVETFTDRFITSVNLTMNNISFKVDTVYITPSASSTASTSVLTAKTDNAIAEASNGGN